MTKEAPGAAVPLDNLVMPWRWVACFTLSFALPVLCWFVGPLAPQNGIAWDLSNAAGLIACSCLFAANVAVPRVWSSLGGSARGTAFVLGVHRDLSYLGIFLIVVHIVGLLILDATVLEYLKIAAPAYMHAGLIATFVLLAVLLTSVFRIRLSWRYASWRHWHVLLSFAAMVLVVWHVLGSNYYVNIDGKKFVFVTLLAGPALMAVAAGRSRYAEAGISASRTRGLSVPGTRWFGLRVAVFFSLLGLLLCAVLAIPNPDSRAETRAFSCWAAGCD